MLDGDPSDVVGAAPHPLVVRTAVTAGSHRLVQISDFGLWPGPTGERFLDDVAVHLERHDATLLAIAGER